MFDLPQDTFNFFNAANELHLHSLNCFKGGGGGVHSVLRCRNTFQKKWHTSTTIHQRGIKYTFSERPLRCLSKNFNFMSVGSVALILLAFMPQSCHNALAFT